MSRCLYENIKSFTYVVEKGVDKFKEWIKEDKKKSATMIFSIAVTFGSKNGKYFALTLNNFCNYKIPNGS